MNEDVMYFISPFKAREFWQPTCCCRAPWKSQFEPLRNEGDKVIALFNPRVCSYCGAYWLFTLIPTEPLTAKVGAIKNISQ